MDFYNKIKSRELVPTDDIFEKMIRGLFEYDTSYNIYDDFSKAPVFYRYFIGKDTTEFFKTLTYIYNNVLNPTRPLFMNANIATIMAAATFHMNKLYCIRNKITTVKQIRSSKVMNYISRPYYKWLSRIVNKLKFDNDNNTYFVHLYTYIFMDKYIYDHDKNLEYLNLEIDLLKYILIPITDDNYTDIYGFGLNQYKLWDNKDKEYNVVNNFIVNHQNYLHIEKTDDGISHMIVFSEEWQGLRFNVIDTDQIYDYVKNLALEKYSVCMLLDSHFTFLLDYEEVAPEFVDNNIEVVNNEKSQLYITNLLKIFEVSNDLITDTFYYIGLLNTRFDSQNTEHIKVSIFFPFIKNIMQNPVRKNIEFVELFMLAIIARPYDGIFNKNYEDPFYEKYHKNVDIKGFEYIFLFCKIFGTDELQKTLYYILDYCFDPSNRMPSYEPSVNFDEKGYKPFVSLGRFNMPSLSRSPETQNERSPQSPGRNPKYNPHLNLAKKMKHIINILIPYLSSLFFNYSRQAYNYQILKNYLKKYSVQLQSLGINVEKYIIDDYIARSPPSNASYRSINNDKKDENIHEMFSGFNKHFLKFAKKLSKIYTRTVLSPDYDCPHRIEKIQNYLVKRYSGSLSNGIELRGIIGGKEYTQFYDYWNIRKYNSLIGQYKVYYDDIASATGYDAGGVWRTFIAEVATQMKDRFQQIPGSDRYILRSDVSDNEAIFIGLLLILLIVNNVRIKFKLSLVYLAYMMFHTKDISNTEKYIYFVLDEQEFNYLKPCEYEIPDLTDASQELTCNPDYILREYKFEDKYEINNVKFKKFINTFDHYKKIFYSKFKPIGDKIRIFDLDQIISISIISSEEYKAAIFDNLLLYKWDYSHDPQGIDEQHPDADCYNDMKFFFLCTDIQYKELYENLLLEDKETYIDKQEYCRALLQYWTGSPFIIPKDKRLADRVEYTVKIIAHETKKVPLARTCFLTMELPVYDNNDIINNRQTLFKWFMQRFINNDHKTFGIA